MDSNNPQLPYRYLFAVLLAISALVFTGLACNTAEEPLWTPETPKEYTAETTPVEVYVLINEAGQVVPFGGAYAYGANASMRYVLRFWDVGNRGGETYSTAVLVKAYTPITITAINADLEASLTEDQKSEIYARTAFPTTEEESATLTFSGGPEGNFAGVNSETGKDILGYMDWRDKEWEMHVCLYHDISKAGCVQDFLVLGEEPFYNWP